MLINLWGEQWLFAGIRLMIKGFFHSAMPSDIRELIGVMRSRVLLTPRYHIVSLQTLIDNDPAA